MTLKFILREPNSKGNTLIVLLLNMNNERLKFSTGLSVVPEAWNNQKKVVRSSVHYCDTYNEHLSFIKKLVEDTIYNHMRTGTMPDKQGLKILIKQTLKERLRLSEEPTQEIPIEKDFWYWFEQFIDHKKRTGSTIDIVKDYNNSLRKHLMLFEKWIERPLEIEGFKNTLNSLGESYVEYLTYYAVKNIRRANISMEDYVKQDKTTMARDKKRVNSNSSDENEGLSANTVGKNIKNLKAFLNWCFEKDVLASFSMKHMESIREDVDKIYLKESELELIEKVDLSEPLYQHVRDVFLLGCETGMRFGDLSSMRKEYIRDGKIYKDTNKTGEKVCIPLSKRVKTILDRYDNNLPSMPNITEFNIIIRKVAHQAGLFEVIPIAVTRRGKRIERFQPKCDLVSSHTGRRTFCTLKFLKDMPAVAIMKFTGHRSERAFMRYLKLEAEVVAEKYKEFF